MKMVMERLSGEWRHDWTHFQFSVTLSILVLINYSAQLITLGNLSIKSILLFLHLQKSRFLDVQLHNSSLSYYNYLGRAGSQCFWHLFQGKSLLCNGWLMVQDFVILFVNMMRAQDRRQLSNPFITQKTDCAQNWKKIRIWSSEAVRIFIRERLKNSYTHILQSWKLRFLL